jgi:glycosyltransferase involved in cell wall biosynthesis
MKKLCWVVSNLDYSKQFDQIERHLSGKYELSYIFLSDQLPTLFNLFKGRGCKVFYIEYATKNDMPAAILKLYRIFRQEKPDIVHTHLFEASFSGIIAAWAAGIKSRVLSRHHSNEAHLYYPPRAVYYDKLLNLLATKIIAVSDVVADVLKQLEKVPQNKIEVLPHGFQLEEIISHADVLQEVKKDYDLSPHYPVVGVVSRFVQWKGIQFIVPAFGKLLKEYPHAKLVLANARGSYSKELIVLLEQTLEPSQYVCIDVERRIFDLFKAFDIFVHTPIMREIEAYGQVYIESLASEVPSIFTLSGIANSFVKDRDNAIVVPYQDSDAIYRTMKMLLDDQDLRQRIAKKGKEDVWKLFHINLMMSRLDALYSRMCI